jgi:hypothetical protein
MKKLLCLMLLVAGCGSGLPATIVKSTVPVTGKVIVNNRPAANVVVVFHAKDPPGNDAMGVTGQDGSFTLGTFAKDDGAVPGRYVVTAEPHPTLKGTALPPSARRESPSSPEVEVKAGAGNVLPPLQLR